VITSQNLPVNEKVGYVNSSHPTSYSQTSCATNLYNIQQGRDESVFKYLERFKEIKSQYFNLSISDSDLANLAFRGLKSSLRDSLKGIEFHSLASVLVRAIAHELRMKKEDENNLNLMNVQSEFVTSKESSLATQEHDKHNKTAILDFSKAEGVMHFSSDYHIIGRQVQAKKNSENQIVENQDKGGEKKTLACQHEVISSKLGRPGLTGPKTRSDRPI
jgi:hypothetical protein